MRKQIWIPCVVILAVCLLLIFVKTRKPQNITVLPQSVVQTNQPVSGQLHLEFWRDISNINKQPFDWKLQLTGPWQRWPHSDR